MQAASSETKPEKKTKTELDIDRSLERHKVFVDGDSNPLTVLPVLTWNNPLSNAFGKYRTVLYLQDGQPKSVCCFYTGPNNRLHQEFGSMTRSALRGERDGETTWRLAEGSLRFLPVPDADAPLDNRRRRLSQMKRLIQRFTAIETLSRKGEPTRELLRLLPTPLYRYEKESDLILDGAVFCFVHTTDPEVIVVLEAVGNEDAARWEYAFVTRTTMPAIGQLDKKDVWSTKAEGFKSFRVLSHPR